MGRWEGGTVERWDGEGVVRAGGTWGGRRHSRLSRRTAAGEGSCSRGGGWRISHIPGSIAIAFVPVVRCVRLVVIGAEAP